MSRKSNQLYFKAPQRICSAFEFLEVRRLLATYWVDNAGDDAAAGSQTAPFATLQHAADVVSAGDTVIVRPGTYTGFDLRTDGTPAARITFQAASETERPRITQRNVRTPDGINLEGADYITIQGFEVSDMPRAGIRTVTNQFVEISNNYVANNMVWGIFSGFSDNLTIEGNLATGSVREHGIYVSNSGDFPTIRRNRIWGNNANGIHMNGDESQGGDGIISGALVLQNVIYDNGRGGGSGINADGVQGSRFVNNLLYDNHASGISLYRGDGAAGSSRNIVANNTVYQAQDSRWALNIQNGSTENQVYNNILLNRHSFRGSIDISPDSLPGFVSHHNIVMERFTLDGGDTVLNLEQWRAATGKEQNSFVAAVDAIFEDVTVDDYHLRPGSPAIDTGFYTGMPRRDFEDQTRISGNNIDIGADEFLIPRLVGDANNDGAVDLRDFTILKQNFGSASFAFGSDIDNDGIIGLLDFSLMKANFGKRLG